ncbi:hypothetical protein V5O48_014910 [Marasmius crinis-equi]|uniref:SH3 domain-containing protein n=1 Tax=Marasmius crinis-equi TaxID=585013 RepID=A0ABR3EVZ1_9AGAR
MRNRNKNQNPFVDVEANVSDEENVQEAMMRDLGDEENGTSGGMDVVGDSPARLDPKRVRMQAVIDRLEADAHRRKEREEDFAESSGHAKVHPEMSDDKDLAPPNKRWKGCQETFSYRRILGGETLSGPLANHTLGKQQSRIRPTSTTKGNVGSSSAWQCSTHEVGSWVQVKTGSLKGDVGLVVSTSSSGQESEYESSETSASEGDGRDLTTWNEIAKFEREKAERKAAKNKKPISKAEVLLIPRVPVLALPATVEGQAKTAPVSYNRELFSLADATAFGPRPPSLSCLEIPPCSDTQLCEHTKSIRIGTYRFEHGLLRKRFRDSELQDAVSLPVGQTETFVRSKHPSILNKAARMPPPEDWAIEPGDDITVVRWVIYDDPDTGETSAEIETDLDRQGGHTGVVEAVFTHTQSCDVKMGAGSWAVPLSLVRKKISAHDNVVLPEGSEGVVLHVKKMNIALVVSAGLENPREFHVNVLRKPQGKLVSCLLPGSRSRNVHVVDRAWHRSPNSMSLEPPFLRAKDNCTGATKTQLTFCVGDEIKIVERPQGGSQWWFGELNGHQGFVRASDVALVESKGPSTPVVPWKGVEVVIVGRDVRKGQRGTVQDVNVRPEGTKSGLIITVHVDTVTATSGLRIHEFDYDNLRALRTGEFLDHFRSRNMKQQNFYRFKDGYAPPYENMLPHLQLPLRVGDIPRVVNDSDGRQTPLPDTSGGRTPLPEGDSNAPMDVWHPEHRLGAPFQPGKDDFENMDCSTCWIERPSLCVALAGREILADVKGNKDKWVSLKLDQEFRRVIVYHRAGFDHRSTLGTTVDPSEVQMSSKRPNLSRERGLMVVVNPPHLGLLVRRVWHTSKRLKVRAVKADGSANTELDEIEISGDDLAFVKESEEDKKKGNKAMEPFRQAYRRS